jgi:hypothetical protein
MDWVLFALTVVSLAAAAAFALVTWRLLREDRRRSRARVAALSAVLDEPPAGAGIAAPPAAVPVAAMFTTEPGTSVSGRPLIKAAVVGVMAVLVVVYAAMGGSRERPASAAVAQQVAPLELMSMRHARDGATLTVTGLVRNPPAGAEARRVAAVVFVFDRAGGFVASGRAPLDFVVLEPGGESPFVVTIPNAADVARYRVSFRTETGVVRHVDRRAEQLQLAQQ